SAPAPKTNWPRLALAMLLSVSLWAYFVQAFFRAYAAEFYYAYCPAYLEYAHGVSKERAGDLASYPLLALTVGCLLAGSIIDLLLAWTGNRWISRSGASFIGMAACAGCFALAAQVHNAEMAVAFLSL